MCGFLGQFGARISDDQQHELNRLLKMSKFRGPDETRVYCNSEDLWLGFNRLAILDTSECGSQPMHSDTQRYTIVFNGEIYNHLELRNRLNYNNWRGHSDTETLLQCLEEWGFDRTINLLDGMFAFAIYDRVEKSLMCARDFAGVKPFFFGWNGSTFIFASQYDQIARHSQYRDDEIDPQVLRLYLEQHFIPAPFGLIKQTGQLEPGQWCKVSESKIEKGYYWRFPEYARPTIHDQKTALEIIGSELSASVSAEMLSDVPLGAFLSGGIDSPLICHYAALHSDHPLKTFTIGSESKVHNESHLAQQYADLIGTEHDCSSMSADSTIQIFDEAMECIREPMGDFSVIPTYLISKLARTKVTVALSGDGGDELFFGYERFWSIAKNIKYQALPWALKAALYKADKILTKNRNMNSGVLASRQSSAHRGLHNRFSEKWIELIFPHLADISTPETFEAYTYPNTGDVNQLIQSMRKAEFYGMMQKTLRKVDLASMGVSLEVRVPFLKKSFIEAVLNLNPMLSYGPNRKKQLLKDHLEHLYPEAPIDNLKRGFSVPLGKWLQTKAFTANIRKRLLNRSFLAAYGGASGGVQALLDSHGSSSDQKWPIFTLLALRSQTKEPKVNDISGIAHSTF